jgi:hypothetical protein
MFEHSWNAMVANELVYGSNYLVQDDRIRIYWGRVDDHRIPKGSRPRREARKLIDALRRTKTVRGYPASLRVYRREEDLLNYLVNELRKLKREIDL